MQGSGSNVMPVSDSVMSDAPGSVPDSESASRTESGLGSAFRPSVALSRPSDFDFLSGFSSPGAGFAPMADPLASMSAHLQVPSLPPSAGTELDNDFDMDALMSEFLVDYDDINDNNNDNTNDQEERGRKQVRS